MSLPLDEAMARIAEVASTLSISEIFYNDPDGTRQTRDYPLAIKRTYTYWPDANRMVNDLPCWINQWESTEASYRSGGWAFGTQTAHLQLFVAEISADAALKSAAAIAFYPKFLQAFAAVKLGGWGPITVLAHRSNAIPALLEYAGKAFVGLDLFLDVHLKGSMEITA